MLLAGQAAHEHQQAAQITQLRLSVAMQIYPQLIVLEYQRAYERGKQAVDPFGTDYLVSDPDGADGTGAAPVPVEINLGLPAHVAIQAADCLLINMGILAPPVAPGGS